MKKNILRAVAVPVVLIPLFFMFAPEERTNSVVEGWRRMTSDNAQACLDYERQSLKDPEGARLVSTGFKGTNFFIIYKAKNGYGTYGTMKGVCSFSSGKVDPVMSQLGMESLVMDEQIKCFDIRKTMWNPKEGRYLKDGPSSDDCEHGPSYERAKHSVE